MTGMELRNKYEAARNRAASAMAEKREALEKGIRAAEVIGGAFLSGMTDEYSPQVMGVPTSAGLAIAGIAIGIAMEQDDLTALSLGFGAGYMRDQGRVATQKLLAQSGTLPDNVTQFRTVPG